MTNTKFYTDKNFKINYHMQGNGPVIILLHGYMDDMTIWDDVAKSLADKHKLISIDLPGHGKSKYLKSSIKIGDISDSIIKLLRIESIEHFILIGYSYGGYIALDIMSRYKKVLKALILVHSHPYPDTTKKIISRQRELSYIKKGKFELIKPLQIKKRFHDNYIKNNQVQLGKLKTVINSIDPDNTLITLNVILNRPDRHQNLLTCHIPVLFCLSEHDDHINYQRIKIDFSQQENIDIELFKNSKHMCFWEEKDLFLLKVSQFISMHLSI